MFEVAELGQTTSKAEFKAALEQLRPRLLSLGQSLRASKRGVIVLIGGVEGAGKSEVVNRLTEWLDPRGVDVHSFWEQTDEEKARPRDWRFWRRLPARGRIGLFFGSWYTQRSSTAPKARSVKLSLMPRWGRSVDWKMC